MTNPGGDTLPKGDIVADENFFVSTVNEVALLGIPEVCANVIGYIASLYVYYLFHDWLMRLEPREIDKIDATIWRRDDKGEANLECERATSSSSKAGIHLRRIP